MPRDPKWEQVTRGTVGQGHECTLRMRVPGGWLYRTVQWVAGHVEKRQIALAFVPDLSVND